MRGSARFWLSLTVLGCLPLVSACGDEPGDSTAAESAAIRPGDRVTSGVDPAADGMSADVTVAGRIVDEATGEGVAGGYVIVLAPGVTFEEWDRSAADDVESLMAGAAVTDSLGGYEVPDLPRGETFTVIVAARGHAPAVFESGLSVEPDDPTLTRIADVPLEQR